MTLQKINIGVWEEGTPLAGKTKWHYFSDDPANPAHVVVTGPVSGLVTITHDGEEHTYDVSDHVIEAPPEHHGAIDHAIGMKHEVDGHPLHSAENPFVHECTDMCPSNGMEAS